MSQTINNTYYDLSTGNATYINFTDYKEKIYMSGKVYMTILIDYINANPRYLWVLFHVCLLLYYNIMSYRLYSVRDFIKRNMSKDYIPYKDFINTCKTEISKMKTEISNMKTELSKNSKSVRRTDGLFLIPTFSQLYRFIGIIMLIDWYLQNIHKKNT